MKYIIKLGTLVLQGIYQCIKLFPVKNKITLISRQSNTPSIDFELLTREIKQRSKTIEVICLCKTLDGGSHASVHRKILYGMHMLIQMYHMATSKVVILDTYCIVASLLHHRKSLKIIQMWHSMGTMKLFGYTAIGNDEGSSRKIAECMHMHANYDYFIAASENYKKHLANGFGCNVEKAFICPLPRYDLLKNRKYKEEKRKEIYYKYPELSKRKKILYCPTFRKDERQMGEALKKLIDNLPDGYDLIVKLHPLSKINIVDSHVWRMEEYSTFDMLFVADYVISDYSCVVYEAGIMNLPLCFYVFDIDQYTEKRGFAFSYETEVKGVISRDPSVIMKAIQNDAFDMEAIKAFIGKYISRTENATVKLTDFIVKVGGMNI